MTHRERFDRLFRGEAVDRAPFVDYMGPCNYPSCLPRWKTEGLNKDADIEEVRRILGFDYVRGIYLPAVPLFFPEFEQETLRREGDKRYSRNRWGGIEIQQDGSEFMPLTLKGAVKDRESWERVRDRLGRKDIASRFSRDFDERCRRAAEGDLPIYAGDLPMGFFGALREIFGFNELMYAFYDEREIVKEVLDALCDLWIELVAHIQARVKLDYFFIWEDMCSKSGPLISPGMFREFLLPRYRRFTHAIRAGGCGHIIVDSDGDERPLIPLWLEGGVDIVFPFESQFGLDIREVRDQYPELGIIGGVNKRALEFDRHEMDKELAKVPYMLESGRYIPCCDHGVTNQVSWDNYRYFYERLRELVYKYPPAPRG